MDGREISCVVNEGSFEYFLRLVPEFLGKSLEDSQIGGSFEV